MHCLLEALQSFDSRMSRFDRVHCPLYHIPVHLKCNKLLDNFLVTVKLHVELFFPGTIFIRHFLFINLCDEPPDQFYVTVGFQMTDLK